VLENFVDIKISLFERNLVKKRLLAKVPFGSRAHAGKKNIVLGNLHDTNHNNQQMTKDTSSISKKDQSSPYTKPSPTKPQESISIRRTRYKSEYQKFFLLVFP